MPSDASPIFGLRAPLLTDPWGLGGYRMRQLRDDAEAALVGMVSGPLSDVGFPAAATNATTAEVVLDRITIPAAAFERRLKAAGHAYTTVTQAAMQTNLILYIGSTAIGYARNTSADTGPRTFAVTGKYTIPAATAVVLEMRMSRQSGTGSFSTSASANLTNLNATLTRSL